MLQGPFQGVKRQSSILPRVPLMYPAVSVLGGWRFTRPRRFVPASIAGLLDLPLNSEVTGYKKKKKKKKTVPCARGVALTCPVMPQKGASPLKPCE
ncbi:hypothetical protein L249_3587 [Ophiocordyceps polyrhachis-furcata BCC 54312]|uniref:Uncharacterized protein n=1 Tax=Ophiocordyceps polyrhachis-furcata BCC 54312 TaxID=1330021 RepID=A0A367LMK6_9HYPO|nr:hypothetical protein L249_3587 [Ophiocordyceps polyrhachis-furcata BCC 54312]